MNVDQVYGRGPPFYLVQNFIPLNEGSQGREQVASPELYFWGKATKDFSELCTTCSSPELYSV